MYFSALEPKVTKEFIFSKGINQESIMQFYTGLDVSSKKLSLSPFRNDHKVTCSFYKSKSDILYLHDFATNEHINCFQVVMKKFGVNYYEALNIIAQDFGLIKKNGVIRKEIPPIVNPITESQTAKIQVKIKDYTEKELNWWKEFGISLKTLKKYHVYSLEFVFLNGELKFTSSEQCPIYGYYFGKDKNKEEKWKIYFPMLESYRFLNNTSKKLLQGYKQLPKTGDLLVVTKSMKDCMAFYEFNIAACAPNSETLFLNDKQLEEFKQRFKHILVLYDSDKPGRYNMAKIRREHPELNYYFLPKRLAKDFTDTIKMIGVDKMKELVNQFMSNYKFK